MPIKRRFQVFVSSTYTDLKEERQIAVQSILKLGHIPAGMELFAAGNRSQLAVIREWIQQSDIFILILGSRYGSIEPDSGKSYTHLEYEYAVELNKPYFSVVMADEPLATMRSGMSEIEGKSFDAFRKLVRSNVCKHFSDVRSLQSAIYESLVDVIREYEDAMPGWVSSRDAVDSQEALPQIASLSAENSQLRKTLEIERARRGSEVPTEKDELLERVIKALGQSSNKYVGGPRNSLEIFLECRGELILGKVTDLVWERDAFADLATFGLIEVLDAGAGRVRAQLTPAGKRLLAYFHLRA